MQQLAHNYAKEMLLNDKSTTWIFSDGSVTGPTRKIVGGGFVITEPDGTDTKDNLNSNIITEHCFQLPSGIRSIALAEITSMLQAFKHILNANNIHNVTNHKIIYVERDFNFFWCQNMIRTCK